MFMLIIGFLRPWRTVYGTKLMSFAPLMAFHFLGNVATVKRAVLALILPHKRHPESSKANKS